MAEFAPGSEALQVDNPPDTCATCFFVLRMPADGGPQSGALVCARNSPTQNPQGTLAAVWPIVQPDFWCGEFSDTDPGIYAFLQGFTGTITTATLGSAQGTMTFTNGVLTAQKAAT